MDQDTTWPWTETLDELRRWALFLDVDGTLLDIAQRPGEVVAPDDLMSALKALVRGLDGALAFVSGREIADLDGIFAPLVLAAAGVHGAFIRYHPGAPVDATVSSAPLTAIKPSLEAFVANHPGCLLEDKQASLAVHYRLAPEAQAPLETLVGSLLDRSPRPLAVIPGRMVVEIRVPGFSKGTAIRKLMATPPFAGRTPVFAGDDVTDQDGFDAVMDLGGHAVQVGDTPGVRAPVRVADPAAFRAWLGRLADRLGGDDQ